MSLCISLLSASLAPAAVTSIVCDSERERYQLLIERTTEKDHRPAARSCTPSSAADTRRRVSHHDAHPQSFSSPRNASRADHGRRSQR
ncbi:MAG: hypothetical protein EOO65_03560 [Methanosarcinales archaeon]|nr:MAG: hypothetical protein EOO65_03560 [Methanosarcinales archaeon]